MAYEVGTRVRFKLGGATGTVVGRVFGPDDARLTPDGTPDGHLHAPEGRGASGDYMVRLAISGADVPVPPDGLEVIAPKKLLGDALWPSVPAEPTLAGLTGSGMTLGDADPLPAVDEYAWRQPR